MSLEQFKTQVLLLHSEQSTLDKLITGFNDRYTVHCATSGSEALNTLGVTAIDVLVTAHDLPGMSGLDALREARRRSPDTLGILLAGNDGEGVEALVGAHEVFQIVRGGVTPESLRTLIDNATRQARLMALAESANDTTADMDASAEHIVMETSANGSSIITDATGRMPALKLDAVAPAANVGSRAVDVLVLSKDEEFLITVKESARGMHNIIHANTLAQADDAVRDQKVGVAVIDAAMVGDNVEKLTLHLRTKAPRLVAIVAGRRDDGEMLMDLINRGKVYRFLLKPVSPGRARLAIEASARHHLEAPDAAFRTVGSPAPAAPKATTPRPVVSRPAPRAPAPSPSPAVQSPAARPVPRIVVEPRPVPVEPTPAFVNDSLGDAFSGDDSSFTETMTGIFRSVGDTFAAVTGRDGDEPAVPAEMSIDGSGADDSILQNPKILGIGALATVLLVGLGWWIFSGSDDVAPIEQPQTGNSLISEADPIFESSAAIGSNASIDELSEAARAAATAGEIFNPPGRNAIELYLAASQLEPDNESLAAELATVVKQALGMAESSLLAGDSTDAAAALQRVTLAEPNNARLPFLNAQLTQMQLRDYLSDSRQAIRDGRFEDAAVALKSARSLNLNDTSEVELVAAELSASLSEQRVDDVLAKAKARLDSGKLTSPSNDNARYYYELALSNDPGNAAAVQGLSAVASRLVLQARNEIDAGRFEAAEALLADARRLDPNSSEIANSSAALSSARDSVAQQQRATQQRAAPAAQAASQAPAKTFAVEATPADAMTDEKVEITPSAVAASAAAEAANATEEASGGDAGADLGTDTAPQQAAVAPKIVPIAASALNRTKYVAPKYPRAAQRRGLTGWVEVEFTVDVDGSVKSVSVIASDPGVTFVSAAVNAVEKWEFEPVIENNQAVQKRAMVRMMFAVQ